MERLEAHRTFFARLITATVGVPGGGGRLAEAFAATPRERFVGPGPWRVFTAGGGVGGLLLIARTPTDRFSARFLGRVMFIPCVGARDDETAQKLTEAFKRDDLKNVQSLRRGTPPDETSWCAGNGWWLSTAPLA